MNKVVVLIPLFRSFIFTKVVRGAVTAERLFCFNPFIQVFYFYQALNIRRRKKVIIFVLIPLFRSFIFTHYKEWAKKVNLRVSFNPFIQVFYFYKDGNENYLNKVVRGF